MHYYYTNNSNTNMIVKIKDKDVELKYTLRAVLFYENIQKKSFSPETTTDVLVFMFCVLLSSDKSLQLDFNDFLDIIDENPNLLVEFSNWLIGEINKTNMLSPDDEKKKLDKKAH